MENDWCWEQNTLINELIQGMEVARKLKADLTIPSSVDTRDLLVQRILSSYDKALLILRWNASTSNSEPMDQATKTSSPRSPRGDGDDVGGAVIDHQEHKPDPKKRKMMPKWMDQVRVSSETGLEGPHEDSYSWRKYGQKDILGAKYPRSYYRCTFRKSRGCWATKQVQRSDEDPTIFDIAYRGKHTCRQGHNAILPSKSAHKLEIPYSHHNSDIHHPQPLVQESLTKFRNILTVNTNNLGSEEMECPFASPSTSFGCRTQENRSLLPSARENDSFLSSLSQTQLLSPNTPESNYFPSPSFVINELDGVYNKRCSESDITDMISPNTSATNSPIFDFNFSLDPVEIDSNFRFNAPGFFS